MTIFINFLFLILGGVVGYWVGCKNTIRVFMKKISSTEIDRLKKKIDEGEF